MKLAKTSTEYSITRARPSKALALLPLLSDFEIDSIEVVYEEAVKGYTVPLKIEELLKRVTKSGHSFHKANDYLYIIKCFERENFMAVPSGDYTTVIL